VQLLKRLICTEHLLIDELGYLSFKPQQVNAFLRFIDDRYNRVSTSPRISSRTTGTRYSRKNPWSMRYSTACSTTASLCASTAHHCEARSPTWFKRTACSTRKPPPSNSPGKSDGTSIVGPPSTRLLLTFPFTIPAHWTPEQALAVVEPLSGN